ncbi:MAG TPA: peptidylprolyl isomerase [Nitrospirota bacterium]
MPSGRQAVTNSFAAVLALLLLMGCSTQKETGPSSPALAQVNGVPITVAQFYSRFKLLKLGFANSSGLEVGASDAKIDLLGQMIEEEMYLQEAKKAGITVSQSEVDQGYGRAKSEYGADFEKALSQEGFSVEEYKADILSKLTVGKLIDRAVYSKIKISREEALRYFGEHKKELHRAQSVKARQIVVDNLQAAREILKELKRGTDFSSLARAKSLTPDSANGGDLGYFAKGDMPPEFDAVFKIKTGHISDIIKTPYGYHIFRVDAVMEAADPKFEEAEADIRKRIAVDKGEDEFIRWHGGLKGRTKIDIDNKRLAGL